MRLALALLVAFFGATWQLTEGFEAWTFEDARRLQAAGGRLQAARVDFEDSQGQPLALDRDTLYLVDFIYASCDSVCSALGAIYTQMQSALAQQPPAERRRIRLLSVTFDRADTQQALAKYAKTHRADPGLWSVARVPLAAGRIALLRSVGIVAQPDGRGGFVHNGAIHLLDGHGRVLAVHDYEDWQAALEEALARSRL